MGGGDNNPNSTSTIMASSNAPPSGTPSGINNLGSNTSSLVTTTAPPIFTFQPSPRVSTTTFNIPAFGEYRSSFGGFPAAAPFNDSQTAPFTFTHPYPLSGFGPLFSTSNPPPNSTFTNPFTTQAAAATNSFSIPAPPTTFTTTFTFPTTTSSVPTFDFSSIPKPMESEEKAHQTPPLFQHTFSFGGGLTSMAPPTIHVCKKCGEKSFWGEQWGSRVAPYTPTLCCDSNPGLLISLSAMTCYNHKSHEELKWEDYQLQGKPQGQVAPPPTNEFATFGGVKPLFALPVVILPVMASSSSGAFNIIP
ncbi:hypothetical protein LWI29_005158 [Acer saccharum]|uniref:Uncharacterized protein n=1 Tax=Acer saccharum TaxID=4024 RepID=A0AA39TAU1_ACESA|nr:hypothetical protein LWI29_005158 [Acer saccharum]